MERILIVSSSEKGAAQLGELLSVYGTTLISTAQSGAQARRMAVESGYDLILINAPLCDEFGHELAQRLATAGTAGIIIIVKTGMLDEISDKVEEYGVLVIEKPISKAYFHQTLKMLLASRKRFSFISDENERLLSKISEIRLVDRAKCLLIQGCGFTEPQAHRAIEKQAMDMRLSKKEIAERIIKKYG